MGQDTGHTVVLSEYPTVMEAEMVKGMLETNGIATMVTEQYNPIRQAYDYFKVLFMDY